MHTSLVLVALMGPGAAPTVAVPEAPNWQADYRSARAEAREQGKPLAIFVGSGPVGWKNLTTSGILSPLSRRVLAKSYVCLYVDNASSSGRSLASAFAVTSGSGLILSTLDTEAQAFAFRGVMSQGELETTLQKYTSVTKIHQTETLNREPRILVSSPATSLQLASNSIVATGQPVVTQAASPVVSGGISQSGYNGIPQTYAPAATYGGFGGGFSGGFGGGFTSGGC